MKKIIKLIIQNLELKIECKKILKSDLSNLHNLLKTFTELHKEFFEVLEQVKKMNFKDVYFEEHMRYNDLLKLYNQKKRDFNKLTKEIEKIKSEKTKI